MRKFMLCAAFGLASWAGLFSAVQAVEPSQPVPAIMQGQAPAPVYRDYYIGTYDAARATKIAWQKQGLTCELVQGSNGWYVRVWTNE